MSFAKPKAKASPSPDLLVMIATDMVLYQNSFDECQGSLRCYIGPQFLPEWRISSGWGNRYCKRVAVFPRDTTRPFLGRHRQSVSAHTVRCDMSSEFRPTLQCVHLTSPKYGPGVVARSCVMCPKIMNTCVTWSGFLLAITNESLANLSGDLLFGRSYSM